MTLRHRHLALLLALLPVPLSAQGTVPAELLAALEDRDLDERRELAMRTLTAWPESPVAALRVWAARGEGFRRQVALLRVLGERQELSPGELRNGLASEQWVVRFEAARAAGNCFGLPGFEVPLRELLEDPFPAVRREALASLERRAALGAAQLRQLLEEPQLAVTAAKVWLAAPQRFGPELLRQLLQNGRAAPLILQRGLGWLGPECFAVLAEFAAQEDAPVGLRARALLHLPVSRWPAQPEELALRASQAEPAELAHRLTGLLPREAKERLLEGLFDAPEREFWDRMVLAYPLSAETLTPLAERHRECPTESLSVFLRYLRRCAPGLLARVGSQGFAHVSDEARRAVWIAELAPLLKDHKRLEPAFRAAFAMDERIAALAFRACIGAQLLRGEVIEWARAERQRLLRHGRLLLLLDEPAPAEFYLSLVGEEEARLRALAASGLREHVSEEKVRVAVREGFARETAEAVRSAWLYALFAFADEDEIARVVTELAAKQGRLIRHSVRKWFESSDRPFVLRFLQERKIPGWEREALLLRATRGEVAAGRELWSMLHKLDEAELLRARKGVTRALLPGDRALFESRLLGEGEARALPHVRDEMITLLRARRDLPWGDLLRRAFQAEQDQIVREQLAAALAERKDFVALESHVKSWIRSQAPDEEGLLLEVMGALSGEPSTEELRFLVRVLVAPIARDPLAGIRKELERMRSFRRVDAQFPLLRPAVLGLSRAKPADVAAALRAEFSRPERRLDWVQASKGYLLLALNERRGASVALPALAPLVEWAQRLGPRPHRADGELFLLSAELRRLDGDFAAAARSWRAGMRDLIRQDLPTREIERISRDLVPDGGELGWSTLHAHGAWLAAIAASEAGDRPRALKTLWPGLLAARGEQALQLRLRETRARIE